MEDLLELLKDAQWAMAKNKWVEMNIDRRINAAVSEAAVSEAAQHSVQATRVQACVSTICTLAPNANR